MQATNEPIGLFDAPKHYIIIGTAGHVDHGKTTLIRALTGTDTDRLAEEKARGMTIDLGFATLELPGEPPIDAGIVDVPGHERFVKNMLSGAGGVDVALVVVSAEEGPMPQTREHLDILQILGVSRGVAAVTKIDRVDDELLEIAVETVRDALSGSLLAEAPIIPVSAETGAGLAELRQALADVARTVPLRVAGATPYLPVDRVFTLPGIGTVATGTLRGNRLTAGETLTVQPQGLTTRARTLQSHGKKVEVAYPGQRVAVNLPSIEVGQIERGAVLAPPGAISATTLIDVHLSLLPTAPRALRHRERIRLHLGTGETLARILLIVGTTVEPGATEVPAQLQCETPIAPVRGERFVARTYSPARAVGGGIVLEANPARRVRRGRDTVNTMALFSARALAADDSEEAVYAVLAARNEDFGADEIAKATGLARTVVDAALDALAANGRATRLPDAHYLSDLATKRVLDTARRTIETYHRQNPLRKTMPRDGLRAPLAKAATVRDYAALVGFLAERGVVLPEGNGVRAPTHVVAMPVGWRVPADEILAVYAGAGFQPPSPDNFQANYPRDVNVRTILNVLAEDEQLFRISDDLYLHRDTLARVRALLPQLAATPDGITVGSLRDATGSSRKVILPLLEYLDAQRWTIRVGEHRNLVESGNT